jgi:transposase
MLPPEVRCVVGIDVAKEAHVVCALEAPTGRVRQRPVRIAATADGHDQLLAWLADWGASPQILIGLEATGVLWEPLHDALTRAGYAVLLLNPRQTASWASSLGPRAKTDGLDARTLARGLLAGLARASSLPSETVQGPRALTRTRADLVVARSAARQRLHDELVLLFPEFVRLVAGWPGASDLGTPAVLHVLGAYPSAQAVAGAPRAGLAARLAEVGAGRWGADQATAPQAAAARSAASSRAVAARSAVVRTLAAHLLDLRERVAELEAAIADLLNADADGRRLRTIPGIGPQIAAMVRAELGDAARFNHVDQVVAYAGLDPRTRQSGQYVGQKRLSKRGPGALRHALYLGAVVAARNRPEWRARYQRLLDRGRGKKEALVILSRALLRVIYHVLRAGETYDPARLQPAALVLQRRITRLG